MAPPTCRVLVYYEEDAESPDVTGINRHSHFRLGSIGQFVRTLSAIQRQLIDAGADSQKLANALVADLFTRHAGNVLLTASGLPMGKFLRALQAKSAPHTSL